MPNSVELTPLSRPAVPKSYLPKVPRLPNATGAWRDGSKGSESLVESTTCVEANSSSSSRDIEIAALQVRHEEQKSSLGIAPVEQTLKSWHKAAGAAVVSTGVGTLLGGGVGYGVGIATGQLTFGVSLGIVYGGVGGALTALCLTVAITSNKLWQ